MKGLYLDYSDKQEVAEQLQQVLLHRSKIHAQSNPSNQKSTVDANLFLPKTIDLLALFKESKHSPLSSDYPLSQNPKDQFFTKTQEEPPRYLLKQKRINQKGDELIVTVVCSCTSEHFEVSAANIMTVSDGAMTDLDGRDMPVWTKIAIDNEEQLKEWAAAEYFNYEFYIKNPLDLGRYSRILSYFGFKHNDDNRDAQTQLNENPLFFPINRMMHEQLVSFEMIELIEPLSIRKHLYENKRKFEKRFLPGLAEEMDYYIDSKNKTILDRIISTPLLSSEFERRVQYLKDYHDKFNLKSAAVKTLRHPMAEADSLTKTYLSLIYHGCGYYRAAVDLGVEGELFTRNSDRAIMMYTECFDKFIDQLVTFGHAMSDDQMKDAYDLYDDIIADKLDIFITELTKDRQPDIETKKSLTIARFLLLNNKLCEKVRESRPKWYYQLMMRFEHGGELENVLASESGGNKEARAISLLFDRQLSGDLTNDCMAALALFDCDASHGVCNTALLKEMVKKYGDQLENHKLFYELILRYPTELIQHVFDVSKEKILGEKIIASKSGHVTMDLKHDLMAVKMLIKTGQDAIAKPILTDMYSRQYYCALSLTEKQQLNDLCDRETSLGSSRDALRQKASQYKVTSMGYWDRVLFLREDGRSWLRSLWDACVNTNTIIISDWSKLAFKFEKGTTTLKQLHDKYRPKTDVTALSVQLPSSNSRVILDQLGVGAQDVINDSATPTPVSSRELFTRSPSSSSPRELKQEVSASLRM